MRGDHWKPVLRWTEGTGGSIRWRTIDPVGVQELVCYLGPYAASVDHSGHATGDARDKDSTFALFVQQLGAARLFSFCVTGSQNSVC